MILGKVVGEVWSTKKHPKLKNYKMLIVQPYGWFEPGHDVDNLIAIDPELDAGVGDDVIVCMGQPARWKSEGKPMPVEAIIMAVVDSATFDRDAFEGESPLKFLREISEKFVIGKFKTQDFNNE